MPKTPGRFSNSHATFREAYCQAVKDVISHGSLVATVKDSASVGSSFGQGERRTKELLSYEFEVTQPSLELLNSVVRPFSHAYCVGNYLWSMAGSDDVEWIAYYNKNARRFSDDGKTFNAPFGSRLFGGDRSVSQLEMICRRLEKDPSTRRATIAVLSAEDNLITTKDYPCCLGVQFMIRDGELCCVVYMRSQSVFFVLPYDVFLFIGIQQWLAARLGIPIGFYRHVCTSLHIYEDEIEFAELTMAEGLKSTHLSRMDEPLYSLPELLCFESRLRGATTNGDHQGVKACFEEAERSSGFWRDAKVVLILHAAEIIDLPFDINSWVTAVQPNLVTLIKRELVASARA